MPTVITVPENAPFVVSADIAAARNASPWLADEVPAVAALKVGRRFTSDSVPTGKSLTNAEKLSVLGKRKGNGTCPTLGAV